MKRLLPILTLALLGLSACDSGTLVSPLEPEVGGPSFAKAVLPAFELTPPCSEDPNLVFDPEPLERGTGAPAVKKVVFGKCGFEDANLVLEVFSPKTTTVKAWLNGATILLPSAIPHSSPEGILVTVSLAGVWSDQNTLEVRLSAKPGTQINFWVEGDGGTEGEGDPGPIIPGEDVNPTFTLGPVVGPTADMATECGKVAVEGRTWTPADWNDVKSEVIRVGDASTIPVADLAWVMKDGFRSDMNPFTPSYYMVSAIGVPLDFVGLEATEPEGLLLVSALSGPAGQQPVLCIATP